MLRRTKLENTQFLFSNDHVKCDTIHSLFKIPVDGSGPMMNWALMQFDVIMIDEVGMVTLKNMLHIERPLRSLPVPCVTIFIGDPSQQLPLDTVDGKTITGSNIFQSPAFSNKCHNFTLYQQHRITCTTLKMLLGIMRITYLSRKQLQLVNNRASNSDEVGSEVIIQNLENNPCTMFLTVTKRGCKFINNVIIQHLFQNEIPLCENIVTSDEEVISIYKHMNIFSTENINTMHNIVRGEILGLTKDEQLRKHLPRVFSLIKNEI